MTTLFTTRTIEIISKIPAGRVTTYGIVAEAAGNRVGGRQVARILHSSSDKFNLPWHRVVNRQGRISLKPSLGYERQRLLLEAEGVVFAADGSIDLSRYLWWPVRRIRPNKSGPGPR